MHIKATHEQIAHGGPGWLVSVIEALKIKTGAIHVASGRMTYWEDKRDQALHFEVWFDSSDWTGRS